ncbi:MAG: lipoate--protein ligase family protein [Nitrososphaerales archaeon]|nr:lipoate--protein ligase family protein [Nitrososphaerales archaeon]
MKLRLLEATLGDPFSNVAADEAIFTLMKAPILRVWDNQRCVVIGRGQLAELETDLGYCSEEGIPVVRRFTAGGAVYNGPGNLNWSFFVPRHEECGSLRYSRDANALFSTFAGIVIQSLRRCGVATSFEPPNRIVRAGGKVSGLAAYISREGAVCHGTLLIRADLAEVSRLTTPRPEVAQKRYARSTFAKVANTEVDRERFVEQLLIGAEAEVEKSELSGEELALTDRLEKEKYRKDQWNLGDPFALDYS